MSVLLLAALVVILLSIFVCELLTYSVGDGGVFTRFYRKYKSTNADIALGMIVSGWVIWKGSTFVAIVGVIVFLALAIAVIVRFENQLTREEAQRKER